MNTPQHITDTPAFLTWFGGSKIVDSQGNPLIVYHGTGETFDNFEYGIRKSTRGIDSGKLIFYFTPRSHEADLWAVNSASGTGTPRIVAAYLSVQNPKYYHNWEDAANIDVVSLQAEGYDGIIRYYDDNSDIAEIGVFSDNQIWQIGSNVDASYNTYYKMGYIMYSSDQYESLLNTTPLSADESGYANNTNLPYGTWLRKYRTATFEKKRAEFNEAIQFVNIPTKQSSVDTAIVDTYLQEAQLKKILNRPVFHTAKEDPDVFTLDLPPLDEAEFFSKILWSYLHPEEPVVDPEFVELMTSVIYNIADSGKLHSSIRNWIADQLIAKGEASASNVAEQKADELLSNYEDYKDILRVLDSMGS